MASRGLILRRMPPCSHPELSRNDALGAVQAECADGCSPGRGQPENLIARCRPSEVFIPRLSAWIVQRDHFAADQIERSNSAGLAPIAFPACQPEIVRDRWPTQCFRHQMIDQEVGAEVSLIGLAVAAAVACLFGDKVT